MVAARATLERVAPEELGAQLDAGALVVDIRPEADRRAEGELDGAIVIERIHLEWRLDPTSPDRIPEAVPGRRVVIVCNEGYSSVLAATSLVALGVDATDLDGGYRALVAAGRGPRRRLGLPGRSAVLERTMSSDLTSPRRLLGFPDPVDEVSARLVASGVVTMVVLAIALDWRWLTAVLAYGFVARVLTGPTLSPLGQLVTRVLTPALDRPAKLVPGPPKRFAQGIGVVFSVTALVLTVAGQWGAAQVVLGMLATAAFLEAALALCLGCKAFAVLMRIGVIPDDVCERCNDIWATNL